MRVGWDGEQPIWPPGGPSWAASPTTMANGSVGIGPAAVAAPAGASFNRRCLAPGHACFSGLALTCGAAAAGAAGAIAAVGAACSRTRSACRRAMR